MIEVEGVGQVTTPKPPPPQPQPQLPPAACPGPPIIASLAANRDTIEVLPTMTGKSTLSWGAVLNATSAVIDQGIGGVATPGSTVLTLDKTTTFTLTATGCGGTTTKQVTIVVKTKLFTVTIPSVDLAVTDLYADNMPQGKVWVRVTNNGPATLTNYNVDLSCSVGVHPYSGGMPPTASGSSGPILVNLNPGQTAAFETGISIDTTQSWYDVTCSVTTGLYVDSKPSNNSYSEKFPPPP